MDTPNSITGRPGSTYRVNDATGTAVARVSRLVSAGWWGPAGWYDQNDVFIGFDEKSAVDWITTAGIQQMVRVSA